MRHKDPGTRRAAAEADSNTAENMNPQSPLQNARERPASARASDIEALLTRHGAGQVRTCYARVDTGLPYFNEKRTEQDMVY
jgi:hypothetical protein